MFAPEVYQKRRSILKNTIQSGIVLMPGNELSPMNYKDNTYPFRQDSNFIYFFGINIPGLAAIIDIDNDTETIFGDELTIEQIIWTGSGPTLTDTAARIGIHDVRSLNQLYSSCEAALGQKRKIHFAPPYRSENLLKLSALLRLPVNTVEKSTSLELVRAIVSQRSRKEAEELKELDKAVSLSAELHAALIHFCRPGQMEYELVAYLESIAAANNSRTAYPTILTINGQILHNHFHGNRIKEGDMVLCDAGVEIDSYYCGDLTRTFPVSKTFNDRQKNIYQIVLTALEESVAKLKPGVPFRDVHDHACMVIVQGLKMLGLINGDPEEVVRSGAHALFFQCGLGHMMGLDVHDMEDLGEDHVGYSDEITRSKIFGTRSLRLARKLEPGFVLTVEPGIYFIPELIDLWQSEKKHSSFINYHEVNKFRDFGGIRIEDNYVIENAGSKILGKGLAKQIREIESMRG